MGQPVTLGTQVSKNPGWAFDEGERLQVEPDRVPPDGLVAWHTRWRHAFVLDWNGPLGKVPATLRARGYVGVVPFYNGEQLEVRPKIGAQSLLAMVDYAWDLRGLVWDTELMRSSGVAHLFEFLVERLATGVLQIQKEGFVREYEEKQNELAFIRGTALWGRGEGHFTASVHCRYSARSADNRANRILAAALKKAEPLPFRQDTTRPKVRKAQRALRAQGVLAEKWDEEAGQTEGENAIGLYRQRRQYRLLHALSRFILQNRGPSGEAGVFETAPFLLYLPRLFEQFVGQALRGQVYFHIKEQWRLPLQRGRRLAFIPDFTLLRAGEARAVVDCKYKWSALPEEDDIQQVAAYALRTGAPTAYLVYPQTVESLRLSIGNVEVRTLGLDLANGPVNAAEACRADLLKHV